MFKFNNYYESWNCREEDHSDQQERKHKIIHVRDTQRFIVE